MFRLNPFVEWMLCFTWPLVLIAYVVIVLGRIAMAAQVPHATGTT